MRLSLFVSAVLATTLFAGGALADRPGEDGGGRTSRTPVREMRIKEVRDVKEARPHETPNTRVVKDSPVAERLRSRGDMVDRNGAAAGYQKVAKGDAAGYNIKAQRAAEKKLDRMNSKKSNAINCAPGDDACQNSARSAAAGAKAATGGASQQTKANDVNEKEQAAAKHREEVQKKQDELRAERLREMLYKMACAKKAEACTDSK